MSIVIIEDEKPAARRLSRMLVDLGYEAPKLLHSVEESIPFLQEHKEVDLLFLDIQLSDGLSFEIFDFVEVKAPIIFTTAYDEYALQAFKHNSIDYLLKPIDKDELIHALKQFESTQKKDTNVLEALKVVSSKIGEGNSGLKKRWMIQIGAKLVVISTETIAMFYAFEKAVYLLTHDGHSYPIDYSLDELRALLNPDDFFRINRSTYINFNDIAQIHTYSNSRLKIESKADRAKELIVSREKVKEFKHWVQG